MTYIQKEINLIINIKTISMIMMASVQLNKFKLHVKLNKVYLALQNGKNVALNLMQNIIK